MTVSADSRHIIARVVPQYTVHPVYYIAGISCMVTLYSLPTPCSPAIHNNTSVGQGFWFILGSQPGQETEEEVKEGQEMKETKQEVEVMEGVWFEED